MPAKTPTAVTPPRTAQALMDSLRRKAEAGSAESRWLLRLLEDGQRAMSGGRVKEDSPGPN
jgi:hypothetical protein